MTILNQETLLNLILANREEFIESVEGRENTSKYNKCLHGEVLKFIKSGNMDSLSQFLFCTPYLNEPLRGVLFTMNVDMETKSAIINAYQNIVE